MSRVRCQAVLCSVLGLAACAPPNTLQGSLSELTPLTFEKVSVQVSSSILVLQYQHTPPGGGQAIPFQLVLTPPPGQALAAGTKIDLAQMGTNEMPVAVCSREAPMDPRHNLPPIKVGELDLTSNYSVGATASGEFHILFGEGGDVGEGRTVDGTFSVAATAPDSQGNSP
jgi:hypothetical protein